MQTPILFSHLVEVFEKVVSGRVTNGQQQSKSS
jgi:hypothetical protein